jgi:hypothetical protein
MGYNINISLKAPGLDDLVEQDMALRWEKAPEARKSRFDLSNPEKSKHNERVSRIRCFVNQFFGDPETKDGNLVKFTRKLEDGQDILGSIALGILGTRELRVFVNLDVDESSDSLNEKKKICKDGHLWTPVLSMVSLPLVEEFKVGQYFSVGGLTVKEAKEVREYQAKGGYSLYSHVKQAKSILTGTCNWFNIWKKYALQDGLFTGTYNWWNDSLRAENFKKKAFCVLSSLPLKIDY